MGTGWVFSPPDSQTLLAAMDNALTTFFDFQDSWQACTQPRAIARAVLALGAVLASCAAVRQGGRCQAQAHRQLPRAMQVQVLMKNGMTRDLSWDRSAAEYEQIFRWVMQHTAHACPRTWLAARLPSGLAGGWLSAQLHLRGHMCLQVGLDGPSSESVVSSRSVRYCVRAAAVARRPNPAEAWVHQDRPQCWGEERMLLCSSRLECMEHERSC